MKEELFWTLGAAGAAGVPLRAAPHCRQKFESAIKMFPQLSQTGGDGTSFSCPGMKGVVTSAMAPEGN